jgi:hypothetical protein
MCDVAAVALVLLWSFPSMLTNLVAAFLIVLTASPITAPFSTCDLASLLGTRDAQGASSAPNAPIASVTSTPATLLPPAGAHERIRFVRSLPATTWTARSRDAASSNRAIAATAIVSSHSTPPLILRL